MLHENQNEKSARQMKNKTKNKPCMKTKNEKSARQNEKQIQNRNAA